MNFKFLQVNEIEGLRDMYDKLSSSPSKKYILVVVISMVGLIFIMGLYCGCLTKRSMYVRKK